MKQKKLLVIDGQGGRMGAALVSQCKAAGLDAQVIAVGANSAATTAMLKAGADAAATGENPVVVNSQDADGSGQRKPRPKSAYPGEPLLGHRGGGGAAALGGIRPAGGAGRQGGLGGGVTPPFRILS